MEKPTEAEAVAAEDTAPPPPKAEEPPSRVVVEEESLQKCIWNGETKQFLGRTCSSWFFITVFYLIFFFCLFCFFVVCWYISLTFIDPNSPHKQGDAGILGSAGPGLTVRPSVDREHNGASTLIWFQPGSFSNYQFWTEQLHNWFKHMPEAKHKNVKECVELAKISGKKTIMNEKAKTDDKSCYVNPDWYGPCAEKNDKTFGFDRAEPCFLFKLNRIFGWVPEPFTFAEWEQAKNDGYLKSAQGEKIKVPNALVKFVLSLAGVSRRKRQVESTTAGGGGGGAGAGGGGGSSGGTGPNSLAGTYGPDVTEAEAKDLIGKYIIVWCDGEFDYDKETIGSIQYYPGPFIPAAFFPFQGQKNYQAPFLMLQLKRPMPGAMVSIVCQAFAKNIEQNRDTGIGYTRFQVLIG